MKVLEREGGRGSRAPRGLAGLLHEPGGFIRCPKRKVRQRETGRERWLCEREMVDREREMVEREREGDVPPMCRRVWLSPRRWKVLR